MDSNLETSEGATKGWSRRKQARPGEILDAALKAFAEKGYAATRMEDIAARAGVTKGTIYLYFSGKEEVFKTLVREMVGRALANATQQLSSSCASARERLVRPLTAIADFLHSDERIVALPKIIIAESGNFPELARFWRDEVIDKAIALIAGALKQGAATGEFRPLPAEDVAKLCVAPILLGAIWRTTFAPLDAEAFDFDAFLAVHIDVLLHGLTPEGKSP
jgi:AcrR family transcriptional regulator